MEAQAKIDWHAKLIDKLGWPCRIDDCETPAERLRYRVNPVWGIDRDGETLLNEEDFLAELHDLVHAGGTEYEPAFQIEQVQALCLPHFEATLPKSGGGTLGKPDQLGDQGAGPSESVHARTKGFRARVLELLGQKCSQCNRERQVKSLEVRLRDDVAASFWAQHGLSSWADKYEFLVSGETDPKELVEAVCRFCADVRVSDKSTPAKQNLRARVVAGYGGRCGVCSDEVPARVAWVVRKPGFPVLRHAGGVGRKLTSKQKYERLLAEGCPKSHELRCPAHRDSDSLSPESQVDRV